MIKKIICMLLCLTIVFSLAACGGKDDSKPTEPKDDVVQNDTTVDNQPTDEATEPAEKDDTSVEYREGSVEDVAQKFIQSLIDEDYETTRTHFAVPAETPYFTVADIEWYLPRSNYADVLDITYANYDVVVAKMNDTSDTADCTVTVQDKDSDKKVEFVLHLILDKTNKWGVQDYDFYLDEFWIVAPGGKAVLTVDGVDATDDADSKYDKTQYRTLYKLTYVGKSEKKFAVSSDNFETYEEAIYPVKNTKDDAEKLIVKYEDEAALTYLKTVWAEIYQGILDGKSYSDMIDKLSPTADPAVMETIMTSFELMLDEGDNVDCKIMDMSFCADDSWETHWLAGDKVQICFNYTASWTETDWSTPRAVSMNNCDWVILYVENGEFKIDTIGNNAFFSELNSYTNESK